MNKKILIFAATLFCCLSNLLAVTAYPYPIRFTQPDKTTLTLTMKGDERIKWAETEDGYSLVYNNQGFFCYATKDENGDMIPSQYVATDIAERSAAVQSFLENTPKKLFYSDNQVKAMLSLWDIADKTKSGMEKTATTGVVKFPVILASFSNKAFTSRKINFENLLNQVNYSQTGSVADFYRENSYGQMNLQFVVVGPVQLSQTIAYYGNNNNGSSQAFAREAILAANDSIDFSQFDNDHDGYVDGVHIIFAGYGEESGGGADCIWSHRSSLYNAPVVDGKRLIDYSCSPEFRGSSGTAITNIGVLCHELGHVFGAPDFYDTDYGSSGGEYPGTGKWDIMCSGSWNNNGVTPAHHNPYSKCYIYGWATPKTLSSPESVVMLPAETDKKSFYRVETSTNNEYFLIENRQRMNFDNSIPGSGMLVYRVHSAGVPGTGVNVTHPQKFYVVSSVNSFAIPTSNVNSYGNVNSPACPFGTTKDTFTDNSTPSMKSWAGANTNKPITNITLISRNKTVCFRFMGASPNPGAFEAQASTPSSIVLTWRLYNYNKVLLVYSPNGVFGTPTNSSYSTGENIPGGGTVLYQGYLTTYTHTGLTPATTYNYKIYSLESNTWTTGIEASATTPNPCESITYTVNFDACNDSLPLNWTEEHEYNNYKWIITKGSNQTYTPRSDSNFVFCAAPNTSYNGTEAHLISALINTSTVSSAHLTFWYRNRLSISNQDVLTVKYRTSLVDDWTTLATYNTNVSQWRKSELDVPCTELLQIDFVGTSFFGRGIAIDDVSISAGPSSIDDPENNNNNVNIFPNPAHSQFTISANNIGQSIRYDIFDLMGRNITNGTLDAMQSQTISTTNWKAGVYVIKINAGGNERTQKLIIQ